MIKLQKLGGSAAIAEALIYIAMFIFYGALWDFPHEASVVQKLAFLSENKLSLSIMNFIGYVLFGVLLAILVQSLYSKLDGNQRPLIQTATIFGLIWVCIIISGGMIANLGLQSIIDLSITEPEHARAVWLANNIVVEGLGGGIEIVGGLWMFFLCVDTVKSGGLPRGLSVLGLLIGTAGILTIYPADILTEIFGIGQIVWFIWLGIFMLGITKS